MSDLIKSDPSEELEPENREENEKLSSIGRLHEMAPQKAALFSQELFNKDGSTRKILKAKKIDWIRNLIWLDGAKFNFDGRGYLVSIYNQKCKKRLLKCGRQVEKCNHVDSLVHTRYGQTVKISTLKPGDEVVGFDVDNGNQKIVRVKASESNGIKDCLKIKTRFGNEIIVTENHPLRKFDSWVEAKDLVVGDKIGSLRKIGEFGSNVKLNAYRVGAEWDSTQQLTDDVFFYDKDSTADLIEGFLDSFKKCRLSDDYSLSLIYQTPTKKLSEQLQKLLRKFGLLTKIVSYCNEGEPETYGIYLPNTLMGNNNDILWEEVISIEPLKHQETWAIETETNTFMSEYLIHHNSTMLANEIVINSSIIPYHRSLYVSPSHDQSRQFSNGKLKPYIEDSPLIKKYLQSSSVSKQVFEKSMTNGSIIFLRSAFLNADRARGITARLLCVSGDALIYLEDGSFSTLRDFITGCRVGEKIWTLNEKTFKPELREVIAAHITGIKDLVKVTTSNGLEIKVTPDHRLMTWDGWKEAQNLKVGEDYLLELGDLDPIKEITFAKVKSVEKIPSELVFDLTLEGNHNFFANGILAHNCLDEVQNLLVSNIPVIEECMSHEEDPLEIMSGTPLTLENPLEQYWQMSSQCEWLVPCHAHYPVHWNFLDAKCIGKSGPICNKCGKPINPAEGKWYAFSNTRDIMGYRVSQLMVPWMYRKLEKWKDLIWKYENYSEGQFNNEVLGISFDSATKPVSRMELMACCSEKYPFLFEPTRWSHQMELFAGIDWGEGSDGSERNPKGKIKNASYTVLSIGAYIDPVHFHYFYYRRFEGQEAAPEFCLAEIIRTLLLFRVRAVGADWGHGWGMNDRLEKALGASRVIKFQYVGNQKERKKFDEIGIKIQLARNEVISDFILDIKDKKIIWPGWASVQKYLVDIENIYQEYNEYQRTVKYDHLPSNPDDALHSSIYCREAADVYFGKNR